MLQMTSSVRTTQPPFSSMMFRLLMLTVRIATRTCISRVRKPTASSTMMNRWMLIITFTSVGVLNAR